MWIGLILAALIAVAVAVVYYYAMSLAEEQPGPTGSQPVPEEITSLESELQTTSVEGLDTELNDIERELAQ